MKSLRTYIPQWLLISILILLGLACVFGLWQVVSTANFGKGDFYGYWAAVYLLSNGQNPYDPALIMNVQQTLIHAGLHSALLAYNPPTLFVFILPLAWLPFETARAVWLMVNVMIVLVTAMMLVQLYLPANNNKIIMVFLLFAFIFPQVLVAITMGQITLLVLLGLVACMFLIKKKQWFWAGAALILTTIKPHMVVLPIIYLLIYVTKQRQYRVWLGLILAGLVCSIILFTFRPPLISDLIGLTKLAPINWGTPTIGGLFSSLGISEWTRYIIILLLPLPFLLARYREAMGMELAVALLTLITVPTTFFGWSYDQSILLIPIAQVFNWLALSKKKSLNIWIVIAVIISLVINYLQRTLVAMNDVYYLWVPMFWWLIFGLSWKYLPVSVPDAT